MTTPIFTTPVTNPFGLSDVGSSASPTFVDIDGDGDLDALVGNFDGNTLFYQNTGSASSPAFAAATTIPFGLTDVGYLATPTFVDIDGDGDLDALVGNSYGNTLFFQNTGSATSAAFATATTNPFGLGNEGYNAAPTFVDIDGDGDLDAFVGNRDGNTLFYQNTGTATSPAFAATTTNPFGLSNVGFSASPNFVDIDGDGDLDALMGSGGSSVLFYQNTGTATSAAFAAVTINPFGLSNVGYNVTPTFVDIDGDGDLDALIGNYHGNTVLFINQAATTPPATPGITLTQSSGNTAVTEGGATDSYTLVLDSAPTADVTITLGNTNGQVGTDVTTLTFTSANWNVAQTVTVTAVNDTVGEFKHTGVINYTVASTDANYNNFAIANTIVTVTDNDLPAGNPTFQAPVTNPFGLTDVGYSARPTFVDIDGDGDLDALVGNSYGNTLFYQNTGSASSPAFATATTNPFGLAYVGYNASPTFADIDGDGDLDALVGNILGNTLFYQNTGSASSPAFAAATTNPFGLTNVGFSASPNFVDIDGDGDLDALVGERLGSTLFFENTGSATSAAFAAASTNPFGLSDVGSYAAPTFVDIDGDGDLDALIGNYDGNTLYYQNTGTATSAAFAAATTNPFGLSDVGGYSAPTFVDIDADGDLDAIIGNYNGDTFFFINAVPPTPGITLTQSNGNTAVTEGGSTDSYTLVLDSAPTADVVITLGNTNGQVGTDITTLTFTSANWNVAQTVTVNAVNDTVGEFTNTGVINYTVASTDANYNNFAIANTTVTVTDNDLAVGNPTFQAPVTNPFGLSDVGSYASPTFVDIDGDGDLDALVGNDAGNTLFYQNTGTSSSPAFAATITNPFGLTDVGTGADPTFVDIDGDGDLDALVGVGFGNTLFYQNTGTASSPAFAATTANPFGLSDVGLFASPTFVDIDGDGDLDALVGNGDGNTLFYQNTGTASSAAFAAATTNPFGLTNVGNNGKPTFIDIDGDGDLDAFIGNYNGDTLFYQNTGTATSAAFAAATTDSFGLGGVGYNATPTFVDIDADGDLDAIIGNYNGDTFFFINAVPPTPGITLTQSNGNTAVTEGGSTDSYTLVLDSAPTADVVITLGNTNGQVGTDVTTLTFTSANWNVAQTVTVTAVNDTMGEFTNTGVINYTVASTDANYNNFAIANTIVTVTDNDLAVGNPTFQAPVTNPFGFTDVGYMSSPTFVDIDADGDLDALIGNYDGNTLYYQNTGTASSAAFAAKTTNPFGLTDVGNAAVTTFADIDADGDLDAFVGNGNGNILFYQNTGTASSAAYATPSANTFGLSKVASNASPTFVDIDGDGDLDAFVGERYGNIKYFENTGTSTSAAFATASTNPFGLSNVNFGASPNFVDIDGDGDLDALVGHGAGNTLFYQNTGTATSPAFAVATTNPFGLTNVGGSAKSTFVDIDADGDLDAIIGNYNGDTLFFINEVPPTPGITLTQSNGNIAVTEGGATDSYTLVLDSAPTADVVITLGNTNGQVGTDVTTLTFTSANWNVAQTVTVTAVNDTMGEFTNTGVINYTVASTDANYNNFAIANTTVTVTDNDLAVGNPTFQAPVTNPFGLSNVGISSSVTFVDIDADGDLDAFMGNDVGDSVFFQNTGSATSAAFASASTDPFGLSNVGLYSRPTLVDIDGDGDLDAFVGNWYGNNWFFENTGNATSAAFASASIDPFWLSDVGYLASPTFVDIDNDGDLDAFVGEKYNGTLFFENTGTLTSAAFAASSTNPFGLSNLGYSAKPTFVDIDGDGDLDAFVGTDYLSNLFYENTGSATSAAFATASTDPFGLSNVGSYSSPTFVDIDGDGDLDALIGNSDGDTLFFVNNNAPTSTDVTVTTLEDTAVVLSISDFGTYSDSSVGNTATAWAAVQISTLASAGTLEYNNGTNWVAVTLDQEISVADITAGNLRFTPDLNGEGAGYATVGFKVSDGTTFSTTANTLTVDVTPVNDAPVIGGVTAVTNITDTATASPFSGFTIADVDSGASVTVSVAVDVAAKGSFTVASLTASGFTTLDGGLTYTHTADTPANAQTAIRALIFAPTANRVAPGNTETTTFTVSVNDGIATAVTDNSTTVVSSAPTNTAPTVTNLNQTIGYQVNNTASIADIVITDPDANTFTATLTLASKNSSIGSLTANSGHGETYSAATGVWSVSGTKVDVNAALAAVSFVPVSGGIASTKVAVSISDGMAPALNGTLNFIKGIYGDNNANNLVGTKNDDFISGGAYPLTFAADGKDTMNGGVGNDVYIVNDTTDLVVESGKTESDHTGGIDAVWSSATYNLPVGVENIIATGIAATTLGGNNLNNILDGSQASGANILVGGTGNDTYYLGAGDSVVELAAGGTDLVYSYGSIDMTSWFNIENTTLQGSTSESLTGNTLANVLTGNVGANLLIGATGNDTLNGVEGKDTLDGGLGNDILIGGAGKDVLITGAGSDVIRYAAGVTDTQANAASIANVDLANDLDFRLDKIDLTVKVAAKGALVTGNVTEATFVSDMNILLHQAGVGFNTTVVNDISGAIVTANAGDLSGRSFLAVDLDHNDSFTGSDFVIEITGSTNLASLALTSFI